MGEEERTRGWVGATKPLGKRGERCVCRQEADLLQRTRARTGGTFWVGRFPERDALLERNMLEMPAKVSSALDLLGLNSW